MNSAPLERFDTATLKRLRQRLTRWYKTAARPLPWRATHDPYHIWVSEIMLQQTTVKAVVPYFERFITRFPTIESLAAASEEEVLRYWEGLGYYSRGRNLRLGAIRVCEAFSGHMPTDLESLQTIPGIGRYTAGAIVSFAYDQPAPILEANTLRLYARLLGYSDDPRSAVGQRLLWQFANLLPPARAAGQINQALMEVGSLICTPQAPRCDACPLSEFCESFHTNQQDVIPLRTKRPAVTQLVEVCVAITQGERWLVRRRNSTERWAGLWDFPRCTVSSVDYKQQLTKKHLAAVHREVEQHLQEVWNLEVELGLQLLQVRHSVTRYRIRLICLQANWVCGQATTEEQQWVTSDQLKELPLSVTARQIADWIA